MHQFDKEFQKLGGKSLEWILMELVIFIFFLMTMVIIMIKSRFTKVGINNSQLFEPLYMCKMANKICDSIVMKIGDQKVKAKKERFFVGKERNVEVDGVMFKILLDKPMFDNIFTKKFFREKDFVPVDEATEWITKYLIGNITKDELDEQRKKEVSELDMMQNQSIIYHPESIL